MKTLAFLLLVSLFPLSTADPTANLLSGFTWSSCKADAQCYGGRQCREIRSSKRCADFEISEDVSCFCVPDEFTPCDKNSDCSFGEFCSQFSIHPRVCATAAIQPLPVSSPRPDDNEVDCEEEQAVGRQLIRQSTGRALNYERCATNSDCADNRQCYSQERQTCCTSSEDATCICVPKQFSFCNSDSNCSDGEECVRTRVSPPRCMASSTIESLDAKMLSKGSGAVCFDAEALGHFEDHELVFNIHQRALVLCDGFGSCATPGHIVVWNGNAMMMKSFCQITACDTRVIRVNSPRWRKGLRVQSKTQGLQYTAFAARYSTKFEEKVLQTVVHVGL